MEKRTKTILIVTAVVLLVLVVWGLIGSAQAAKIGIDCNIGLGEDGSMLCWAWEKNVIGEAGEALGNLFDK